MRNHSVDRTLRRHAEMLRVLKAYDEVTIRAGGLAANECPFCHGMDLRIGEDKSEEDGKVYAMHVECRRCGCRGRNRYPIGWCESPRAAVEAWNDREPRDALDA